MHKLANLVHKICLNSKRPYLHRIKCASTSRNRVNCKTTFTCTWEAPNSGGKFTLTSAISEFKHHRSVLLSYSNDYMWPSLIRKHIACRIYSQNGMHNEWTAQNNMTCKLLKCNLQTVEKHDLQTVIKGELHTRLKGDLTIVLKKVLCKLCWKRCFADC